jgi:hypothetical protein
MAVGTPPGVAANTNPGASNPADIALETSHLDIGEDFCPDIGKDIGPDIGEGMDTGSGAGVGTTEGSS